MIFLQILPPSISGSLPSFSLGSMITTLLWILVVGVVLTAGGFWVRDKIRYQYHSTIFRRRQDNPMTGEPESAVLDGKSGYFPKKSGKTVFRIKYGKMPWQVMETSKLPNPKYMLGNRVFFSQIQKGNIVQQKIKVDWRLNDVEINPVEDDVKFQAQMEMTENRTVLAARSMSPVTVGIIVLGVIVVAMTIGFYFMSQAGGG